MTVGRIEIPSGQIIISDPVNLFDNPPRIRCPIGVFPMVMNIRSTPNGDVRIAKASVLFAKRGGTSTANESVSVDSATILIGDANVLDTEWREVGDERIGLTSTPNHHLIVAELIRKRFGLTYRIESPFQTIFLEPISVELEGEIERFLCAFPEYAEFPYFYFRVKTMNSFERVSEAMRSALYTEIAIGGPEKPSVWVMQSGYGDGRYSIRMERRDEELQNIDIVFIEDE